MSHMLPAAAEQISWMVRTIQGQWSSFLCLSLYIAYFPNLLICSWPLGVVITAQDDEMDYDNS